MNERHRSPDNIPDETTGPDQLLFRKVEEAIYRHHGVAEVVVVFLPGLDGKLDLAAFVVPSIVSLNPQMIKHFVESAGYLSADEFPNRYHIVPEIPKTPYGKCQKNQLVQFLFGDD